jgi:hypothetical protein
METTWLVLLLALAALLAGLAAVLALLLSTRRAVRRLAESVEARESEGGDLGKKIEEGATAPLRAEVGALREDLAERLEGFSAAIREVADGLAGLGEALDSLGPAEAPGRAAAEIEPLLREAVETLEARIREVSSAHPGERVLTVEESVSRVLGERGFTEVALVGEPERDGERTRVLVKARRDGMVYKGPVLLLGARVVEQRLRPSYPMFP